MAEIRLKFKKTRRNKKINYLRIQRYKRLIHSWFHFDPVRDLLHLLTVKKFLFHLAAEFLCERKSSIFEDGRNRVAFFIGKFDFERQ